MTDASYSVTTLDAFFTSQAVAAAIETATPQKSSTTIGIFRQAPGPAARAARWPRPQGGKTAHAGAILSGTLSGERGSGFPGFRSATMVIDRVAPVSRLGTVAFSTRRLGVRTNSRSPAFKILGVGLRAMAYNLSRLVRYRIRREVELLDQAGVATRRAQLLI